VPPLSQAVTARAPIRGSRKARLFIIKPLIA
jgi:hypothetical protein